MGAFLWPLIVMALVESVQYSEANNPHGPAVALRVRDTPSIRCWTSRPDPSTIQESSTVSSGSIGNSTCHRCRVPKSAHHQSYHGDEENVTQSSLLHALLVVPHPCSDTWLALIIGLLVSHQFRLTILIADPFIPHSQIYPHGKHTKNQSLLGDQTEEEEEEDDDDALWLKRAILLGIPCEDKARDTIHKRLTLWKIVPDCGGPGPGPDGSGHYLFNTCSVRDAQLTSRRIQEEWKPHVFLADASWMASFWMVEQGNLPTVAVVSDPSTIFPMLVQHHRSWTPSSDRSFLAQIPVLLSQRWQSLMFTWFFMEVNRQRRKEHLRLYRRPLEYLESAVVVLSEFGKLPVPVMRDDNDDYNPQRNRLASGTTTTSSSNSWKNFIVTGPILSPCVPCHNSDGTTASNTAATTTTSSSSMRALRSAWSRDTAASTFFSSTATNTTKPPKSLATILIVPPIDPNPVTVRTLLQGLSLARSSLASYDDCDWDSWTCQKIAKDFQIRWLTMDVSTPTISDNNISNDNNRSFLPPVTIPDFYQEHSVSLLDSVARHHDDTNNITTKSVLLVILPCQDRNARILPSVFEISVLCYDSYHHRHRGDAASTTPTRPGESSNNRGRMAYLVLKSDTNPREIAAPILRLLRHRRARNHAPTTKDLKTTATGATTTSYTTATDAVAKSHHQLGSLSSLDGLTRAVSIIHRIAEINRRKDHPWTSPSEMQRVLSLAVRNLTHPGITNHLNLDDLDHDTDYDKDGDPYRSVVHHDSLLVLLAWIFLGTATLYVAIQELFASSSMWRLDTIPTTTTSNNSTTPTILWTRGPDLDDAWTLWLEWYHDQPDDWLSALDQFTLGKTQGPPPLTTTINTADVKIPVRATPPPPPPPTASSSELHSSPNHNHARIPGQHVRRRKKR